MSKYVWCEDSGSGYKFWKELFEVINPEIIVETKNGNSNLRKKVNNIVDDQNEYYILMDYAVDNPEVLRESNMLEHIVSEKSNAKIIKIHSFEFTLLSFRMLEQWIFAEEDELKDKRSDIIQAKEIFVKLNSTGGSEEEQLKLAKLIPNEVHKNSEQISAWLLKEITRNTGFETDKSKVGDCFIVSCCDWPGRQVDDICGLDDNRLSSQEKKRLLIDNSVFCEALEGMNL